MLDRNSILKTTYFVGALYRISTRTDYKIGTITEIKKLISNKIEYEKECGNIDSSLVFTDKELFELIRLYFEMRIISKVEDPNGKLVEIGCGDKENVTNFPNGLFEIIHYRLVQDILTSTPVMLASSGTNSTKKISE